MRGKAQKVLSELKSSQKSDYITLTSVLAKRFNPPNRENAFCAVWRQRRRLPKESLLDFVYEVSHLPQRAYDKFPYEALDQVSRKQFVRGLSDVDMKRYVDLRNPSSLEEAKNLATRIIRSWRRPWPYNREGQDPTVQRRTAPVLFEEQPTHKTDKARNEEIVNLRKQIESLLECSRRSQSRDVGG